MFRLLKHSTKRSLNQSSKRFNVLSRGRTKLVKTSGTILGIVAGVLVGTVVVHSKEKLLIDSEDVEDEKEKERLFNEKAGVLKEGLPSFTRADVKSHKTKDNRIWVTFRDGVYDVTEFVEIHPGGEKILMGAGGAIDPFWALYGIHKSPEVADILEGLRIGNLKLLPGESKPDFTDPYVADPSRHPLIKVNTEKPFNGESPLSVLGEEFITPTELFFIRNHLPVPIVDEKTFSLVVSGEGMKPITLTIEDLESKFPQYDVIATIQCAGNRRTHMSSVKPVQGLSWDAGAISNAMWSGPKLSEILEYAGLSPDVIKQNNIKHIQFEGLDRDFEKVYGASIPLHKALDLNGDCILALKMNGKQIPADHGHPLRAIVPGYVGARNVKWLCKVNASAAESPSHWQQKDYKGFGPNIDWNSLDYSKSPAIQDLPVQSAITYPHNGSIVKKVDDSSKITVKGYAWSGGGRDIVRVDVSSDGGQTWHQAKLQSPPQAAGKVWAWTLWSYDFDIPKGKEAQFVCKAIDSSYNTQPETFGPIWNVRGVLSTAWHRISVRIDE
eukprot:TRINITY_DN468_c2_g1_i2.p1 TRINITY_DN468_c2_g1~~TRINITY_DN468_c2_g1_i2.p1  ORF type:complete len:553 (+),score=117.92 TRINITY_DN468_c2_g1_i2:2064-3722(+)